MKQGFKEYMKYRLLLFQHYRGAKARHPHKKYCTPTVNLNKQKGGVLYGNKVQSQAEN